ncbi:MAG TPA: glutamate--tRNA ligase [Solirubrobacteraceae bacterium]|jgi:glutamyl-tRNA synthetase|nr:glutamate--tRNA ligase [Solirubrobacteraceae bacterium]
MRVRFAPSPTGALHIGGARTALFNWLLARGAGGELVLRIEDTDRERSTPENVQQIVDSLRWLQLDWDEGPIFQSQRAARHQEALAQLLADGHAYRSQATAQDVKAYKERHGAERGFRGEGRAGNRQEGAVRLRVPDDGATIVHDVIRGDTSFEHVHLDDPVIARADGSVLYNFAVAIDDLDAGITHVVRGEDHLSNTPKQLLVLEALGAPQPLYAHLPLLHGPDGKKLSKRHGAASVGELRVAGYLPEAVRNYLALLGWGSGDDSTVMATDELARRFALERVSRNPAQFDETKLRWLNGLYIRELAPAQLADRLADYLEHEGPRDARALDRELLERAATISQEKIQTLADFWPLAGFFFTGPAAAESSDAARAARARWLDERGIDTLRQARAALAQTPRFDEDDVKEALLALQQRLQVKPREIYQPLRVALAGATISPGIFETVALLGREETLRRVDAALAQAA